MTYQDDLFKAAWLAEPEQIRVAEALRTAGPLLEGMKLPVAVEVRLDDLEGIPPALARDARFALRRLHREYAVGEWAIASRGGSAEPLNKVIALTHRLACLSLLMRIGESADYDPPSAAPIADFNDAVSRIGYAQALYFLMKEYSLVHEKSPVVASLCEAANHEFGDILDRLFMDAAGVHWLSLATASLRAGDTDAGMSWLHEAYGAFKFEAAFDAVDDAEARFLDQQLDEELDRELAQELEREEDVQMEERKAAARVVPAVNALKEKGERTNALIRELAEKHRGRVSKDLAAFRIAEELVDQNLVEKISASYVRTKLSILFPGDLWRRGKGH